MKINFVCYNGTATSTNNVPYTPEKKLDIGNNNQISPKIVKPIMSQPMIPNAANNQAQQENHAEEEINVAGIFAITTINSNRRRRLFQFG